MIANEFRNQGYEVYEEEHCIAEGGSNKRIDILAIDRKKDIGFILDPTIRMEDGLSQPTDVDSEKRQHYEPTVPYFKEHYRLSEIEVIGLMIGARGTIPEFFVSFAKRFKLPSSLLLRIVTSVLKDSVHILHNHLYTQHDNKL